MMPGAVLRSQYKHRSVPTRAGGRTGVPAIASFPWRTRISGQASTRSIGTRASDASSQTEEGRPPGDSCRCRQQRPEGSATHQAPEKLYSARPGRRQEPMKAITALTHSGQFPAAVEGGASVGAVGTVYISEGAGGAARQTRTLGDGGRLDGRASKRPTGKRAGHCGCFCFTRRQ